MRAPEHASCLQRLSTDTATENTCRIAFVWCTGASSMPLAPLPVGSSAVSTCMPPSSLHTSNVACVHLSRLNASLLSSA